MRVAVDPLGCCGALLLVPERAHEHSWHLRRSQHLPERPHESSVDAEKLLGVNLLDFVEQDADLVLVAPQLVEDGLKLVGDVELVSIEHDDDQVCSRSKPFDDGGKLVLPPLPVLLVRQHTRRVDQRDVAQQRRSARRPAEAGEEGVAKLSEAMEGRVLLHRQRMSRDDPLVVARHDGNKLICRRLRPDAHSREVLSKERTDERGLADRVLAEKEDDGFSIKV
mmetsp:Transcript_32619/g.103285  ORF Transcript_32619/g.103285 Transcript_32619/m.103285 type:complete len:223 (+) Transcript_32619:625-1293(+)